MTRNSAFSRLLALAMVLAMMFTLTLGVQATEAEAAPNGVSAELLLEADGLEISGKITLSPAQMALAAAASMVMEGEEYASLSACLWDQALTISSNFLDGAYGVGFANLAQNLEKSIFAPNSGSDFALDQQTYDTIQQLLSGELPEELTQSMAAATRLASDEQMLAALEVLANFFADAMNVAGEALSAEVANRTLTIDEEKVPVSRIRVTADSESILMVCEYLVDTICADAEIQNALTLVLDVILAEDEDVITGAEVVQMITGQREELLAEIQTQIEESAPAIIVTACTAQESEALVMAGIELTVYDETISLSAVVNEALDHFRLEMSDGTEVIAVQFEIVRNTSSALQLRLGVYVDEEKVESITYNQNKAAKTFEVIERSGTATSSIGGFYEVTDDLFSVSVDSVDGEDLGGIISLNIRLGETIDLPRFTEITGLSEAEFTQALQSLVEGLEPITQMFE